MIQDCTIEDKQAFTACLVDPTSANRKCVYNKLITEHNTQQLVEETDGGLFCVMTDNSKCLISNDMLVCCTGSQIIKKN